MKSTRILLLALIVALLGCGSEDIPEKLEPLVVPITSIELSEANRTLKVGESFTLTAEVKPSNTTEDKMVGWETSDAKIATVSNSGVVTAVSIGEATITAKAGNKTATCKITVAPVEVTGIILSETEKEIQVGDSFTLTVTFEPSDATNKEVAWSSSDESVATVDNGSVIGISVGEAVITVKSESDGITAVCEVSVLPVPVSGISFTDEAISIAEGRTHQLSLVINPENATDKTVSYESLSNDIFSVSSNGLITALKEGIGSVVATSSNGLTAKIDVEVESFITEFVTGMTFGIYNNPGGYITFSGNLTLSNYSVKRAFVESYFIENASGYMVAGNGVGKYIEIGEKLLFPVSISNVYGAVAVFVIKDNDKTYTVKRKL